MNMAETMKAFVFLGVGKVGIIEKPLPEPGPRDAVIRTTASFICTSDVHTVKGGLPIPDTATVSIFHASSGFGRDVANGAASTAANLNFEVQTVSYEPHHATESAPIVPDPAAQAFAAGLLCARCLRESGTSEDAVQFAMAKQLVCTTLYGGFRLDPVSGLQVGHQVLIVQWQNGIRGILLTTSDPTDP